MTKITLNNVASLQPEATALTTINNNSATVVTAMDNTLSRDGTTPNQMGSSLDMNSNQIVNLPVPVTATSPLRLQDLSTFVGAGTVTNIPTGGTTGQSLTKTSNANYAVGWSSAGSGTVTSVGLTLPAEVTVTNSPVTSTGNLTGAWAPQTTNKVFAAPNGSTGTPTFRALVAADVPVVNLAGDVGGTSAATVIGANKVTNAQLATSPDATIKSNISGGSGTPSDNTITTVIDKLLGTTQGSIMYRNATTWVPLTPGTAGQVLQSGGAGANPSWLTGSGTGTVTQVNTGGLITGGPITTTGTLGMNATLSPCGRLTVSTGIPVVTSTVTGATGIFYTPYVGNIIPIYDGSNMIPTVFTELFNTFSDATKNPAATAASSVYDLFVWNDAGTIRLGRGPVWTNDTTRSAGTALTRTNGLLLNSISITNGPAANRGTYVGTLRTNGSNTLDFTYGGTASGGTAAFFGYWNMYNRVEIGTDVQDSGTGYTYTTATIRQARASAGNQVTFVQGLQEDSVWASFMSRITTTATASATANIGMAINNTAAFSGQYAQIFAPTANTMAGSVCATKQFFPAIGVNVLSANEQGDGTNANTFNSATLQTLSARLRN